jgi:potassium intermediate/small conductance calcium-activated channel subfamily N protein 2
VIKTQDTYKMAVLIRNAMLRNQGYQEGAMENLEAILKEEQLKRLSSIEMTPEEKLEASRRNQAKEVKKQLMEKKRRQITKIVNRLKISDTLGGISSIFGIILAFIDAELDYTGYETTSTFSAVRLSYFLRVSILITTLLLIYTIIRHHHGHYKISREKQTTSEGVGWSFWKSSQFRLMLFEILLSCCICPPGVNFTFKADQLHGTLKLSFVSVMASIMLLRCYILIRILKYFTKWGSVDADEICEACGCEASHLFMLKGLFKDKPYFILASSMSLSILIFGFAVRTYERPYNDQNDNQQNYDYVWNSMWLVIITMCTVGYGDFFPRTHIGRIIIVVACFWGVFLISMMVVTLTESSEFTKSESRAFEILSRLNRKEEAKKTAAKAIYVALKANLYNSKYKTEPDYLRNKKILADHLKRVLEQFRLEQQEWKQWDLPIEEMLRQLTEKLDVDMEDLRNKIYSVVEIDHQLQRVEKFQEESLDATTVSLAYLEELQGKLDTLIEKYSK